MSYDGVRLTSDLRSEAQPYKRDAAHKHKWAYGTVTNAGRGEGHARPRRVEEIPCHEKGHWSCAGYLDNAQNDPVTRRKCGVFDSAAVADAYDSATSSDCDEPVVEPADVGVMYSFDAASSPSQGSEVLHAALARAVDRFETRETARLVKDEYDVLDSDGESMGLAPAKSKGRGAAGKRPMVATSTATGLTGCVEDNEYEFV